MRDAATDGALLRPVRTVVVDDHAFIRDVICRLLQLRPDDYEVVASVGTAAEAIAACKHLKPSLLILDINLPDQSGVAIVGTIKRLSPATRILLCTAFPKEDWLTQATACGADGFVEKTNTWAEFTGALDHVAGGERYFCSGSRRYRSPRSGAAAAVAITTRERQILKLIASGLTTKEIAARLSISVPTVETHRGNLRTKTGTRNVAALVRYAFEADAVCD